MNLWITTHESKMSVVKRSASSDIDVPDKYDPSLSTSAVYLSGEEDEEDILNLGEEKKNLNPVSLKGSEIEDTVTFGFGNDLYTSFRTVFVGIDGTVNSRFAAKTDGFLGLAPWTASPDERDRNFMYQLKADGYIDHLVFSVYLSMK